MYFCLCISFHIPLTKIWNLSRRNLGLRVLMRIEHREATQGISKWYRSEKKLAWLVRPGKRLLTLLDVPMWIPKIDWVRRPCLLFVPITQDA